MKSYQVSILLYILVFICLFFLFNKISIADLLLSSSDRRFQEQMLATLKNSSAPLALANIQTTSWDHVAVIYGNSTEMEESLVSYSYNLCGLRKPPFSAYLLIWDRAIPDTAFALVFLRDRQIVGQYLITNIDYPEASQLCFQRENVWANLHPTNSNREGVLLSLKANGRAK